MLDSAAQLLRERGASGVTVDAVLAHSGAPRGSVYHHFPGGRSELILAAVEQAGERISGMLERAVADGGDAGRAVDQFVRFWQRALAESEFRAGCPVVAVVVAGRGDDPAATEVVRRILGRWQIALRELLVADGHPHERAQRLATLVVAAIEGAILLARATGATTPLDDVATELTLLLELR